MIFITDKAKIPENPWSRYGFPDKRWYSIHIAGQILIAVGCLLFIVGMFLGEDKEYIQDIGSYILTLGVLPLFAGNRSEQEDEYDKIFRIGLTVILSVILILVPVIYFIKFIW